MPKDRIPVQDEPKKPGVTPFPGELVSKPFDHLVNALDENQGEVSKGTLADLQKYVDVMKANLDEIEKLEALLIDAKRRFNQVSMIDIPQLLLSNGLSEIRLATGEKLKVSQSVSCAIKDMPSFADFLTARGDDSIIKTGLTLGKLPAEMVDKVRRTLEEKFGVDVEINQNIHSATLQKYIKEICAIGVDSDKAVEQLGERYVPLQELPESIGVYTYFKTVITKK